MEKYSVLMSLYDKENPEYLSTAIESMINQTIKPDEIVIVKDGPINDELKMVLDKYNSSYPNLFNIVGYNNNRGLGLALNYGLNYCKNELVARMDTDDISKPNRCEKQLRRFSMNPNLAIVGAYIDEFIGDVNNIISTRRVPSSYEEIYEYAKRRSAFNHPVVMYRKSQVLQHGGYSDLKRNQDVDLFGRMLYEGCKAENISESLLWFRTSDELAKRRRSWENTRSYIDTIRRLWIIGYAKPSDYIIVAIAQIGMFVMPIKLQKLIYKKFLRS